MKNALYKRMALRGTKRWIDDLESLTEEINICIYSDIESLIENYASCEPRPDSVYTHKIGLHSAIACSYNIWSVFPIESELKIFKGRDCVEKYVEKYVVDRLCD